MREHDSISLKTSCASALSRRSCRCTCCAARPSGPPTTRLCRTPRGRRPPTSWWQVRRRWSICAGLWAFVGTPAASMSGIRQPCLRNLHVRLLSVQFRCVAAMAVCWARPAEQASTPHVVVTPALLICAPPCAVEAGDVTLGKPADWPSYGWDNEYGSRTFHVRPFKASKALVRCGGGQAYMPGWLRHIQRV